jgi:nicotinate-nucleotide pyrophosphorylase (carboxylating)
MIEYQNYLSISDDYVVTKLRQFLKEDSPSGDITTLLTVDDKKRSLAILEAEEDLVFVGEKIIKHTFYKGFEIEINVKDGQKVKNGAKLASVKGPASKILTKERVLLNLLQRLAGIATITNQYVEIAKPYNVKILDTRKTTPGMRIFEKYAVANGGGFNHRIDLSSGILIKDNHIIASNGVTNAVNKIRNSDLWKSNPLKIELEVDNIEQIYEGLDINVDGFLLDNMNIETTVKSVEIIRNYNKNSIKGSDIFIESSGGITIDTIGEYVRTGVNAVSVGALTHSVKSSNIHLEFFDI